MDHEHFVVVYLLDFCSLPYDPDKSGFPRHIYSHCHRTTVMKISYLKFPETQVHSRLVVASEAEKLKDSCLVKGSMVSMRYLVRQGLASR